MPCTKLAVTLSFQNLNGMNKNIIGKRVDLLRQYMKQNGLAAFVVPTTDPHASEYTPAHWECRKWISGFSGSAGTAIITLDSAALWTDSRYFLAASEELSGTPFQLMKERVAGTPSIANWLCSQMQPGEKVGLDGWVHPINEVNLLRQALQASRICMDDSQAPFDEIWQDRLTIPNNKISIQPLEYAGEDMDSKLQRLRKALNNYKCNAFLVSSLDEVAWLLNLRGSDVHCNPVFVAYCLVLPNEMRLYAQPQQNSKVSDYLKAHHIIIENYSKIEADLQELSGLDFLLSPMTCNRLAKAVSKNRVQLSTSPLESMKAIKNTTEIAGFHNAMLKDGIALVKFLRWLRPAVKAGGETEISIDRKLTALRAEQPLFKDISFDTIAGYKEHGAIVHYEATPETDAPLQANGLLLIDSGAQYQDGTTDITRTIALGEPTIEEKHIYTLVLKGHIALSRCQFPEGTSGTQIDLAARYAMWQEGLNYGHGTGHGVGSYLCVHEGPHQIRMNYMPAPLQAGMTVTDEPGLYLAGRFGVRTENMLLIIPAKETEFGRFLKFEPLTLCPIDTRPIDFTLMRDDEIAWLNDYHCHVRQMLLPLLTEEADRQWLQEATHPVNRSLQH